MEFIEGRTLRELFDGRPLDPGQALEVTAGVLSALEYSHRSGIVHRDIKPGNVMVTPTGEVKVMDFGIARALADASVTMTATQAVIGTAQYLSPEQARGETVDARSDLYSAGCLLFELLTGRPPFVADSPVAVAYQHVREIPRSPSTYNSVVPETVDRIVLHSLAKDREARYQSAAEFRTDVEAARAGRRVSTPSPAVGSDAATEFLPSAPAAAGTRAMPSAPGGFYGQAGPPGAPAGAGGSMLPGGLSPAADYDYDGRRDSSQRGRRGTRAGGYLMLALGVLVVFGLVAFIVANLIGDRKPVAGGDKVQVPLVKEQTLAEAQKQLTAAGLFWAVNYAADEAVAKGSVAGQDPPEGTSVDKGSSGRPDRVHRIGEGQHPRRQQQAPGRCEEGTDRRRVHGRSGDREGRPGRQTQQRDLHRPEGQLRRRQGHDRQHRCLHGHCLRAGPDRPDVLPGPGEAEERAGARGEGRTRAQ